MDERSSEAALRLLSLLVTKEDNIYYFGKSKDISYVFTKDIKFAIITSEFPLVKRVNYLNVYKFTRDSKYDTERTC